MTLSIWEEAEESNAGGGSWKTEETLNHRCPWKLFKGYLRGTAETGRGFIHSGAWKRRSTVSSEMAGDSLNIWSLSTNPEKLPLLAELCTGRKCWSRFKLCRIKKRMKEIENADIRGGKSAGSMRSFFFFSFLPLCTGNKRERSKAGKPQTD